MTDDVEERIKRQQMFSVENEASIFKVRKASLMTQSTGKIHKYLLNTRTVDDKRTSIGLLMTRLKSSLVVTMMMMTLVRIIMTVVMKMALVEKCNKGPQCWRKKTILWQ